MSTNKADNLIHVRQLDNQDPQPEPQVTAEPENFAADQVGPGKTISLHFALTLQNGELIDSCFDKAPASFMVGDGNMLPGFEQALFGLRAGEKISCELPPEQAFGVFNEANVQRFPLFRFPAELPLSQGLMIDFKDSAGNAQVGVVLSFDSKHVEIDFNHPLADRCIGFRAEILTVEISVV